MNDKKFVTKWVQAYNEDKTIPWVADQLEISYTYANVTASRLRSLGVELPKLKRANRTHTPEELNQLIKEKVWQK